MIAEEHARDLFLRLAAIDGNPDEISNLIVSSFKAAVAAERERWQAEVEQLRSDLDLRNQTALDRKEAIAKLEAEIERLRAELAAERERCEVLHSLANNDGNPDQSVARRALALMDNATELFLRPRKGEPGTSAGGAA